MAIANTKIQETHQKDYQSSIIETLSRNKGGKLLEFCQTQNCKGNESTIFYTVGGTTVNSTGAFAEGKFTSQTNGTETENHTYKIDKLEVFPSPTYAGNWIHEISYLKTVLNLNDTVATAQADALAVEQDKKVITAIKAATLPAGNTYGNATTDLSLKTFVEAVELARLLVGTGERIAIVANKSAIVKLRTDAGFQALSADFQSYFGNQTPGAEGLSTGKIITWRDDLLADGEMYIVVDKSVGAARWTDSIDTSITYHDERSEYLLKARMDLGVAVLDPRGIFKIAYKPAA